MLLEALFIISLSIGSSVASFKKCCREGEVVQADTVEDNHLSPRTFYSCVNESFTRVKAKSKRESDEYEMDNSTSLTGMIAYNVLINEDTHWPSCGDDGLISHAVLSEQPTKASQKASCVDIMKQRYFVFTCEEQQKVVSDFVDIYKLKKCCDKNFSYDVFARQCVHNSRPLNETLNEILTDKAVTFESGLPECQPDDVLVEYHSLVHKLKISESSLVITTTSHKGSDVSMQNSFCIESTFHSPDVSDNHHHHSHLKRASKWIAKVCRPKDICESMPCVRKCCKEGLRMVFDQSNRTMCEVHDAHLDLKFHRFDIHESQKEPNAMEPNEFGILMSKHCDKYQLGEGETPFLSGIDGSLFVKEEKKFYENDKYCVDYHYDKDVFDPIDDTIKVETFVCYDDSETALIQLRFNIYATLLAISAVFLGLTFLVYILLPNLLNLHGKTLVCHVLSLFVAFSFLSVIQFNNQHKLAECKLFGYIVYFSLLSAFSWLNVMCLDIFWTFGSMRVAYGMRRAKEIKRFICYSLYAWGFPCVATSITFAMDTYIIKPEYFTKEDFKMYEKFRPRIGEAHCWFESSTNGHYIFFLAPVGIQTLINVVLFVITAIHCNRVKSEIHRMQMNDCEEKKKRYFADSAIFLMNLKLFIVMGVSWLLEILTTLLGDQLAWWSITDYFNLLQGVFVFAIFVLKRSVLVAFQKKLGIQWIGFRPKTAGSTSTNMSTLDLNSTSMSKHNGKMMKSNSSSTLTNSNIRT